MIHVQIWKAAGNATVTDMTNAGKRGKRCDQISFIGRLYSDPSCAKAVKISTLTSSALDYLRGLSSDTPFNIAADGVDAYVQDARKHGIEDWAVKSYKSVIRGIDAPRTKLTAGNEKFNAFADQDGIHIYDLTDNINLPAIITAPRQTNAQAYSIAAKVWEKVKTATNFSEAQNILSAAGAKLHYYCQMD